MAYRYGNTDISALPNGNFLAGLSETAVDSRPLWGFILAELPCAERTPSSAAVIAIAGTEANQPDVFNIVNGQR